MIVRVNTGPPGLSSSQGSCAKILCSEKWKGKTTHDKEKLRTSTATKVKSVVDVNKPRKRVRKSKYSNFHCRKLVLLASDLLYLICGQQLLKNIKKNQIAPPPSVNPMFFPSSMLVNSYLKPASQSVNSLKSLGLRLCPRKNLIM